MNIENIGSNKCFSGWHKQYAHQSSVVNCSMRFAIYLPPQAQKHKVPVLYWLSGLTCNDENFMQKAGAMRMASQLGIAIVAPDTSPRGDEVADDPDASYDLGLGAGFYLNATQEPWKRHYQMYDYVVKELPALIEQHFPVNNIRAISGHSMGGHGALVIGLRNPDRYQSISAFSPITNPINSPWGQKAFENYLGSNRDSWREYDASELMLASNSDVPILVDQGDGDDFLEQQLRPQVLLSAAEAYDYPLVVRMQTGYDHSYFFISSFIDDHIKFHARQLIGA